MVYEFCDMVVMTYIIMQTSVNNEDIETAKLSQVSTRVYCHTKTSVQEIYKL